MQQFKSADAVFVGLVDTVLTNAADATATVDVRQVYKGAVTHVATVSTPREPAACGSELATGFRYTFFVRVARGRFRTDICSGTAQNTGVLARARITAVIPFATASPTPAGAPVAAMPSRGVPIGIAALLLVLVIAGLMRARFEPGPVDGAG